MTIMYVIDTTILIHDPTAIYKFQEHDVIIPIVVVEEIDKFKRDQSEVGRNARTVSRLLDLERKKGSLSKGVKLDSGGNLRIVLQAQEMGTPFPSATHNNDNWILGVAAHFAKNGPGKCVLVTKDVNLRIKADALGIMAEDFFNDKVQVDDLYTGWKTHVLAEDHMAALPIHQSFIEEQGLVPNQFVQFVNEREPKEEKLAVVTPQGDRLRELSEKSINAWGIEPHNLEQRLAMELLLDPKIRLVSLIGKAGTGKTLLALAAGLQMVIEERQYARLMVGRPIHPLGRDLGYLPGDIDDKIRPWMQPIFDNLEYILHCNSDEFGKSQITHDYFVDKGWIVVEPLTYMRGRSIPNQYLLVDEAQNLSPHEVKSIITRAGHGTKIVLTGDPHQIDHPFLDAATNGISYVVQRLRGQSLFGHILLSKGERSDLAECATNFL